MCICLGPWFRCIIRHCGVRSLRQNYYLSSLSSVHSYFYNSISDGEKFCNIVRRQSVSRCLRRSVFSDWSRGESISSKKTPLLDSYKSSTGLCWQKLVHLSIQQADSVIFNCRS